MFQISAWKIYYKLSSNLLPCYFNYIKPSLPVICNYYGIRNPKFHLPPIKHAFVEHFINPTRFYMLLFIDIRVTLVINIITLRILYMYNIFFISIHYIYVFLYHSFIVILSFSQYCQICYNLICCTIFNQNLTHVMLQIVLDFFYVVM